MKQMSSLTAHCIVKNEENFVWYAIKSVIDFSDKIIVFDTGSTDKTVEIIQGLVREFPDKIIFEEKGECDKKRHTELRQEMVEKTTTSWFLILDGDEVWSKRGAEEMLKIVNADNSIECLVVPFYLCVGDIYHYSTRGRYRVLNKEGHFQPRVFKKIRGVHWNGDYGEGDYAYDKNDQIFFNNNNSFFLRNRYWHASALLRSSKDEEVGLGRHKQVMTYSLKIIGEGFKIKESVPEVFFEKYCDVVKPLRTAESWRNLFFLILFKLKLNGQRYKTSK